MKPIAIIFNDIHIKQGNEDIIKKAFIDMVKKAQEKDIKYIFFAGDCFDSRTFQRQSLLKTFDEMLDCVDKSSCELYAIAGNHDKTLYNSAYSFLAPFKYHPSFHYMEDIKTINFEDINKTITFLPFFEDDILVEKLKNCWKSDILISHFEMEGSTNLGKQILKSKIKKSMVKKWGKVFLGHYHNHHEITENIIHLPSLVQNNFGEDENKGFTIMYDDLSYEIVKSDAPNYKKIEINLDEIDSYELNSLKNKYANSKDSIMFKFSGSEAKIKALDKNQFSDIGISINSNFEAEFSFDKSPDFQTSYDKDGIFSSFDKYCTEKKINKQRFLPFLNTFFKNKTT